FVPGLSETALISRVVEDAGLPVNVMMMGPLTSVAKVAALGVSRASYGPGPYFKHLDQLKAAYEGLS
ncbi:MAG: isocitrate lyase/phosphoenolpyruvate mutase family protein, partial [Pseudomonadota bacterium]